MPDAVKFYRSWWMMWSQSKSTEISHHESTNTQCLLVILFWQPSRQCPVAALCCLVNPGGFYVSPEYMPVTIMDPDPIQRWFLVFASLKAKNSGLPAEKKMCQSACMQPASCIISGAGVWQDVWQETLSRDITAQQRYPVLARGFQRTVFAGDDDPWRHGAAPCILSPRQGDGLVHFSVDAFP